MGGYTMPPANCLTMRISNFQKRMVLSLDSTLNNVDLMGSAFHLCMEIFVIEAHTHITHIHQTNMNLRINCGFWWVLTKQCLIDRQAYLLERRQPTSFMAVKEVHWTTHLQNLRTMTMLVKWAVAGVRAPNIEHQTCNKTINNCWNQQTCTR